MRNPNQNDNFEQFNAPVPATADLAKQQIINHEYNSAYEPLSKAEYADAQWNDLSKGVDNASLPENQKEPLSVAEYEKAQQEELNKNIDTFGTENNDAMKTAEDFVILRKEMNKLIEELLDAIAKARKQGEKLKKNRSTVTLFPIIGSLFGVAKSRKLKKLLKEVEVKQEALSSKQVEIKQKIEIDGISPSFNHNAMIASGIFGTGSIALDNPGIGVAGTIFDLIGTLRAFKSHEKLIRLDVKLEDFEKSLVKNLEQNTESIVRLETFRDQYREGAIENLKGLAA